MASRKLAELDDFAARLKHDIHREFYHYWRTRRGDGLLPGRQHIDPVDIPKVLPWMFLVDVVDGTGSGPRFRTRLVGTGIVRRAGRDATGLWFEEAYSGEYLRSAIDTYRDIVRNGVPHLSSRIFPTGDGTAVSYDRMILPLARDGETVDILAGVFVFHEDVSVRRTRAG